MYLVLALVLGIAAASVLLYDHYKELRPDLASSSTRRAQQLAAVVLVLARAVEGVLDALNGTLGPAPRLAGASRGRPLVDVWDEEDYT